MTVSAQSPVNSSTGNGVTTVFPYTFKIISAADLEVKVDGALQTLNTDYTLTGVGNDEGGDVTFITAPANLSTVTRRRNMAFVRSTDYQDQGDLRADVLNPDQDAPILMLQQVKEQTDRAVSAPVGESPPAALPTAADRAGKFLAFDAEGNPIASTGEGTDAGLRSDLAAGTGSALVGYTHPELGSTVMLERMLSGAPLTPQMIGTVGTADDTAVMQAFAAAGPCLKYIPPGTYRITEMLEFQPGDVVYGAGALSIIDASAAGSWAGNAVVKVGGTLTQVADLSGNATIGDDSIGLTSAAGVEQGDALVIFNPTNKSWSTWRNEYRAGEFVRAHSVSGTTVNLMAPLYDSYNAVAVDVYRLDGASTVFRDFTVLTPDLEVVGVQMSCIDRPVMHNVWCTGSLGASLEFDRCVDIDFRGSAFQTQPPTGDEYGLSIANCHGGVVDAASLNAGRHAIAFVGYALTGSVSSRAITVRVGSMGNNAPISSMDLHGNTEDLRFLGGTFANGGTISGKNHKWIGCHLKGRQNGGGIAAYGGEIVSGSFEFSLCTFESITNPNAGGFGIVDFSGLSANVGGACKFVLRNCRFKAPASTAYAVSIGIGGTTHDHTLIVDSADLECPGLTQFVRLSRSSGIATMARVAVLAVHNLPAGASYVNNAGAGLTVSRYQLPRQYGSITVAGDTASNNASGGATFNHPYPVAPTVIAFKANGTTLGGDAFVPDVQSVTTTGATLNATTMDGANYANTNTGKRYTVQAEVRERVITETIVEVRYEAAPMAACPVPEPARRLLNRAAECAREDRPASCGPGDGVQPAE